MKTTRTILDEILVDARNEVAAAKRERPLEDLRRMMADAPPVRRFDAALRSGFGLIAEIKVCSPSQGPMRPANVEAAPEAYERSGIVRAISVLTNASHFGMSIARMREVKARTTKPVLRKDFLFDDYQVHEARAFGADAVLLMANLLEAEEMRRLYDLTRELGMEALFECHDRQQIETVPRNGLIFGINSRTFAVDAGTYASARDSRQSGGNRDLTTDLGRFDMGQFLPAQAIKVAESGVSPETVARLREPLGYHAALVGTSLLLSPRGIVQELERFEQALQNAADISSQ